jgi:hypothetical protein
MNNGGKCMYVELGDGPTLSFAISNASAMDGALFNPTYDATFGSAPTTMTSLR